MADFELMDVTLVSDRFGRLRVPLEGDRREVVTLPAGAVVSTVLTFRTGQEVEGLRFVEERFCDGHLIATVNNTLGGFRAGGPYELQLTAERLPAGPGNVGTYEVAGRFLDGSGRELARESHRFRIVPPGPPPEPGSPPETDT
ncbi:hypothetical protein [Streptomyces solicathayae]|uniref:Uncharacterized protein n=1 Tax=Streptomyces solicathayae TaxID=3081768 RepID=A0ABZ0LMA9_9ACTN|nr:hypothetical protein [Streptomyces sp. HUAS YS2]WOX20400.1 hypothetical protein R2D22_02975 [Streptomyces sp. HUAS YS2]